MDWLDEQGYDYDVATDEDVQQERVEVFRPYSVVVVTGKSSRILVPTGARCDGDVSSRWRETHVPGW